MADTGLISKQNASSWFNFLFIPGEESFSSDYESRTLTEIQKELEQLEALMAWNSHFVDVFKGDPPLALPKGTGPVNLVLLSYWDNICGPKIARVWTPTEQDPEYLLNICKNSLNSEIFRETTQEVEAKLSILGDAKIVVTTFIFNGHPTPDSTTKYSLEFVSPLHLLQSHLSFHPFLLARIPFLIQKLVVLQRKPTQKRSTMAWKRLAKSPLDKFSHQLLPAMLDMKEAVAMALPSPILVEHTYFSVDQDDLIDPSFLSLILTSHFQTHGYTVIVGESPKEINRLICTLAFFLTPAEQKLCCLMRENSNRFRPGFFIQGMAHSDKFWTELTSQKLIQSPFPTTIVDLTQNLVSQVKMYECYVNIRETLVNYELEQLLLDAPPPVVMQPHKDILVQVKEPSQFVNRVLFEVSSLPQVLRSAYLVQSSRLLNRKALALIYCLESEISLRPFDSRGSTLPRSQIRKILQDVSLTEQALYLMVLATAEKLSPGVYLRMAQLPPEDDWFNLRIMN